MVAVALLGRLDGLEQYFPLLVEEWGVAMSVVPLAVALVVGLPWLLCSSLDP